MIILYDDSEEKLRILKIINISLFSIDKIEYFDGEFLFFFLLSRELSKSRFLSRFIEINFEWISYFFFLSNHFNTITPSIKLNISRQRH